MLLDFNAEFRFVMLLDFSVERNVLGLPEEEEEDDEEAWYRGGREGRGGKGGFGRSSTSLNCAGAVHTGEVDGIL
jgi:hypothetical protein